MKDQKARTQDQFISLGSLVGDEGLSGTDAVYAEQTFDDKLKRYRIFYRAGITLSIPPNTFAQLWKTPPLHAQVPMAITSLGAGIWS